MIIYGSNVIMYLCAKHCFPKTEHIIRNGHFEKSILNLRIQCDFESLTSHYTLYSTPKINTKKGSSCLKFKMKKKNVSEKKRNVHVHHKHFGYLFRMNSFKLIKREMCTNKCPFVQDRKRRNDQTYCMYLYVASFIILFLLLKKKLRRSFGPE